MVKYILLKITINFKGLAINQPKITFSISKAYTRTSHLTQQCTNMRITELTLDMWLVGSNSRGAQKVLVNKYNKTTKIVLFI